MSTTPRDRLMTIRRQKIRKARRPTNYDVMLAGGSLRKRSASIRHRSNRPRDALFHRRKRGARRTGTSIPMIVRRSRRAYWRGWWGARATIMRLLSYPRGRS